MIVIFIIKMIDMIKKKSQYYTHIPHILSFANPIWRACNFLQACIQISLQQLYIFHGHTIVFLFKFECAFAVVVCVITNFLLTILSRSAAHAMWCETK